MKHVQAGWRLSFSPLLCHPAPTRVVAIAAITPFTIELRNRWMSGGAGAASMAPGPYVLA